MTDEPATTPTCGKCGSDLPERGCCPCIGATPAADDNPWAIPDLTQDEKDDLMAALAEMRQPDPRVTALTLRCGQLREQRDEERRQWFLMRDERDDAERQRDAAQRDAGTLAQERDRSRWERDAARAQAVQATTDADGLRAAIEAELTRTAHWLLEEIITDDGFAQSVGMSVIGGVRAVMATTRAGTDPVSDSSAPVDPSATPDLLGPQIGAEQ